MALSIHVKQHLFLLRCNQYENCEDGSDEENCQTIHYDKNKNIKDKQPPGHKEGEKVIVDVDVNITEILIINEVDGLFRVQHFLTLVWKDPRLQFYNLKDDFYHNSLTESEKKLIWTPTITFVNTRDKVRNSETLKKDV